jgi:hypothetical protein
MALGLITKIKVWANPQEQCLAQYLKQLKDQIKSFRNLENYQQDPCKFLLRNLTSTILFKKKYQDLVGIPTR